MEDVFKTLNLSDDNEIFREFCSESFPIPVGAWDGLRYFIVALH